MRINITDISLSIVVMMTKLLYLCPFLILVTNAVVQPLSAMSSTNQPQTTSETVLQTEGGIADGKRCILYKEQLQGAKISEYIVCEDGTRYDAPGSIEGSAADVSQHLKYVNYIGSYVKSSVPRPLPIMRMPGEDKRVMYFYGKPQRK